MIVIQSKKCNYSKNWVGLEHMLVQKYIDTRPGIFFQHFCENSSAKKTQNLPFGQKLKPIFVQKLKLGAAFLNIRKKLDASAQFQYPSKKLYILKVCPELIDWDTL